MTSSRPLEIPAMQDPDGMRIGDVARRARVNTSLIRYYEQIGLLPEPERVSGQRRYDGRVLRRLSVIDVAQRAGMTLDEIRLLLQHGNEPLGTQLQQLAARKLPEIEALIARAERVRAWLQAATRCDCEGIDDCALFDEPAPGVHQAPFRLPVVSLPGERL